MRRRVLTDFVGAGKSDACTNPGRFETGYRAATDALQACAGVQARVARFGPSLQQQEENNHETGHCTYNGSGDFHCHALRDPGAGRTLLLVDRNGTVLSVWIGVLSPRQELEVMRATACYGSSCREPA